MAVFMGSYVATDYWRSLLQHYVYLLIHEANGPKGLIIKPSNRQIRGFL